MSDYSYDEWGAQPTEKAESAIARGARFASFMRDEHRLQDLPLDRIVEEFDPENAPDEMRGRWPQEWRLL